MKKLQKAKKQNKIQNELTPKKLKKEAKRTKI